MNKLNLEDDELKDLFKSSIKENLSADFTNNVMLVVLSAPQQRQSLNLTAPSRKVAYLVITLLFLLLIAAFTLNWGTTTWSAAPDFKEEVVAYVNIYLGSSVVAIASITLSVAVWMLIYIHTKTTYSLSNKLYS